MTAAGKELHQFMLDTQLYQVCLEDEANQERTKPGTPNKAAIEARESKYASQHNAASDQMNTTSESFKEAVAEYQARR